MHVLDRDPYLRECLGVQLMAFDGCSCVPMYDIARPMATHRDLFQELDLEAARVRWLDAVDVYVGATNASRYVTDPRGLLSP